MFVVLQLMTRFYLCQDVRVVCNLHFTACPDVEQLGNDINVQFEEAATTKPVIEHLIIWKKRAVEAP